MSNLFNEAAYNPGSSSYTDPFGAKFDSFDPENIVSSGNNALKSGLTDMDYESGNLAYGLKNPPPATDPKPGKFFD